MSNLSEDLSRLNTAFQTDKKVWAIGGGKGGVGKSLVTANTAITLAMSGYRVIAVDLDLGGANLHTCLGLKIPEKTLSDFITKKVTNVNELIVPTAIKNLSIISGAQDEVGIANLKHLQKNKLLSSFNDIDADYVLIDLGAGTTFNTLDFFISSQKGILVVLPEPTSIENTYRFIKSVFFRKLKMVEDFLDVRSLIQKHMNAKINKQNSIPSEMLDYIQSKNPELGEKLRQEVSKLKFQLIINQARTQGDIDIGFSIQSICKKYFGIDVQYTGYLEYDASVWQSVKKRKPLLMEFPNGRLVNQFDRIVKNLLGDGQP
jgi:flagellar biosynthesis protein FlhG